MCSFRLSPAKIFDSMPPNPSDIQQSDCRLPAPAVLSVLALAATRASQHTSQKAVESEVKSSSHFTAYMFPPSLTSPCGGDCCQSAGLRAVVFTPIKVGSVPRSAKIS